MPDEFKEKVDLTYKAVFGDPANLKQSPGVIAENALTSFQLKLMNETLTDIKKSMGRINWIVLAGVLTALLNLVLRPGPGHGP